LISACRVFILTAVYERCIGLPLGPYPRPKKFLDGFSMISRSILERPCSDDIVSSILGCYAVQQFFDLLRLYCKKLNIVCNSKKTVCTVFKPRCKAKIFVDEFSVGSQKLM